MLFVCFGTGLCGGLVSLMYVMFIGCWLLLKHGCTWCLVGLGLQGGLGRCVMWSCNDEILVSSGCGV